MKTTNSNRIMILTILIIVTIIVAICSIPKNQELFKIKHPTQTKP